MPSLAGGLISAERESGGWQLLLMTPLSTGAILRGKLLSVVWPLLLLLCATLPGYVVMMNLKPTLAVQVQRVVLTLLLAATFAVLVSAAASIRFATSGDCRFGRVPPRGESDLEHGGLLLCRWSALLRPRGQKYKWPGS